MYTCLSLLFLFELVYTQFDQEGFLNKLHNNNETVINNIISSSFTSLSKDLNKTITILLDKGHFNSIDYLIQLAQKHKVDYKDILIDRIRHKQSDLNNLYQELIKLHKPNILVVSPAFYWAEDNYHVHLDIVFSHRHDAPGCSEIDERTTFIFENNRTFHFSGNCLMGDDELFFELEFDFFGPIEKIESENVSRGIVKIRLIKEKKNEWGGLLVPNGYPMPPNSIKKY